MQKILIVMEHDGLRDALVKELSQHFYVIVCSNARKGAALLQDRPDTLILDLFLPGEDGVSFLKRCQPELPATVIALSVFLSPSLARRLSELGVARLIMKPCTADTVVSSLMARI